MSPLAPTSLDAQDLLVAAFCLLVSYLVCNAVYQVYFSPLSGFPGRKLAALTLGYEMYYDVWKWGRYHVEIARMHEEYGPIVRVNPFELHVADPDFVDTLYSRAAPRDKHAYMTRAFGNDDVTFCTVGHVHHRVRRAGIAPFFSKQRVNSLQDLIWRHVEKLCGRFDEFKAQGKPLPTGNAFGCLTADVIIEYAMGVQQCALEDEDFAPLFTQAVKKFAAFSVALKHAPWVHGVIRAIPQQWLEKLSPEHGAMLAFRRMNEARVDDAFKRFEARQKGGSEQDARPGTIFDDLIASDLAPAEKTQDRLSQESQVIIGAALDTTAHALNVTLFHLLANPGTLEKLKQELRTTILDPLAHTPLSKLEALPYLSAVINEGLRLSYGVSSRNARIASSPLLYKQWVIPAGTAVGMSAPLTHHDESIFPDSYAFVPERWLGGKTPDGRALEHFLMTFGRGARQCVGINLARAEMCIVLSALVRRFEMELFECGRRDVDMFYDLFLPGVERGGTGVKVLVK